MSHLALAGTIIKTANLAFELINTGNMILTRIYQRQQERIAEGKELTAEDLNALMDEGDVQAALQKAQIAQAVLAKQNSVSP